MVDNVLAVDALFANGEPFRLDTAASTDRARDVAGAMCRLARDERAEIERMLPKLQRRVGAHNLDSLLMPAPNLSHLLVGSEGTLAVSTQITLALSRLPAHRVMGVCRFPSFRAVMETTRHLVDLGPTAVEPADNNVLSLGTDIPMFCQTLSRITRGRPDCLNIMMSAWGSSCATTCAARKR